MLLVYDTYFHCANGTKVGRRYSDGLVRPPHTHYARQPYAIKYQNVLLYIYVQMYFVEKQTWNPRNVHVVEMLEKLRKPLPTKNIERSTKLTKEWPLKHVTMFNRMISNFVKMLN